MACELRPLKRCDGSARFNFEKTSVMAGVHGPMEAKTAQKLSEESILVVNHASGEGPPGPADKEAQSIIRQTLEAVVIRSQNPLCAIEVNLQCVSDDGGILAAAINASIAALVDAGVALRSQAAAVCIVVTQDGRILLDPCRSEAENAAAELTFVIKGGSRTVISSICRGDVTEETYFEALEAAFSAANTILTFMRLSIERRVAAERGCWASPAS